MVEIMELWPCKHVQITKLELSYCRREKLLPSVLGFAYDWLRFEGHLGNVGKITTHGFIG